MRRRRMRRSETKGESSAAENVVCVMRFADGCQSFVPVHADAAFRFAW